MAAPKLGREGRIYTKLEAAYGTQQTLAAADVLRTIPGVDLSFDPFMRVPSPEKQSTPDDVNLFDRKKSASWSLPFLLRPSGTLNTLPECTPVLESAFGSKTNVTLSTTVASGATTTGATVASAGALAKWDVVSIEVTATGLRYLRILTNVSGAALTWAPALPSAPSVGDDVLGGITFKPTTGNALGLTIGHFGTNKDRASIGSGCETLALSAPENSEVTCTASGPAKQVLTSSTTPALQADPATITLVGGNPPTTNAGELRVGDTAFLIRSFEVNIANALTLRNQELGVNGATEIYRSGRRQVTFNFSAFAETPATAYVPAEAGTYVAIFALVGDTQGNRIGLYLPRVELKVPAFDDPDTETSWNFSGRALASAVGQNDSIFLAIA